MIQYLFKVILLLWRSFFFDPYVLSNKLTRVKTDGVEHVWTRHVETLLHTGSQGPTQVRLWKGLGDSLNDEFFELKFGLGYFPF